VGALISIGLMFLIISSHLIVKGASFIIGLAFFGDPIFQHTIAFLNQRFAGWKGYLDVQK
jgi:hypothetical protein